ncbi:MAG: Gfo/Idh/MocA family protein [Anaerolineae bacterium]
MSETHGAVITVGIIGAGQVGQRHAQAFARLGPEVQVLGVADVEARRAADLAASCGARAFEDYHALLDLTPDIAVVCLPHHLHREVGLAAAEAGSHVLMEKPLANTLEDAQTILEACRIGGVRLAVSFVHRYRVEFQEAHRLIAAGKIGVPATMVDLFGLPGGPSVPSWVWQKQYSGGGILMYSGIHSVDWQRWLLGAEVDEVFCRTLTYGPGDVENGLVATLVFANGCLGSVIGNQPPYQVTPRTRETEIYGMSGCLRIRSGEYLVYSSDAGAYRLEVNRDDPFVAQARDFVAAVREGREPWITGEDGLRALEVCLAIYRSAEVGHPVSVRDFVRESTG